MNIPPAPPSYDRNNEQNFRQAVREILANVLYADREIELQPGVRLIVRSPNGSRWSIGVTNAGAFTSTAL